MYSEEPQQEPLEPLKATELQNNVRIYDYMLYSK